jgi:hypothetical protein
MNLIQLAEDPVSTTLNKIFSETTQMKLKCGETDQIEMLLIYKRSIRETKEQSHPVSEMALLDAPTSCRSLRIER